jgi:glutathione S-transferase
MCGCLSAAQARLDASGGPYLGGEQLSAPDLALAPRLHHVFSALPALKVLSSAAPTRLYVFLDWGC